MAPLPSQSVEMWIPPQPATGVAQKNITISTTGNQYDPVYVQGFNCQAIEETGTAGAQQIDD
jgi:hypothetical protein